MCIILYDVQIKFIFWVNFLVCQVLGFMLEELLLFKVLDMSWQLYEYCCEIGCKWLYDVVFYGSNMVEWCYCVKNGDEIFLEVIVMLVLLIECDVIMVQFCDIVCEEQIWCEMKKLESCFKEFMQDFDEGVMVLCLDGGIEYLSDVGCKLLGVWLGQNLFKNFVE